MADTVNTDQLTNNTNQEPNIPELHVPVGSDYRTLNTDIPLEQPMIFYLDGSKAFYLPHEMTMDENTHLSQSVVDTLTNKRIFQEISIRQGQSGMFHTPMKFMRSGSKKMDMTNYLVRFEGEDSSGAKIYDDEGFNRVQANLGFIDWTPSAIIAQSPGYYKNAHFVIESPDRTKILTTLDFSICIIGNDVSYPRVLAFYASEYQRALFHIKEMQTSADHQLSYLLNAYAAIIANRLDAVEQHMEQVESELDDDLKNGNDKVDKFVKDSNDKLETLNTDIATGQKNIDDLSQKIDDKDLVTNEGLDEKVSQDFKDGKIVIDVNDTITDESTKAGIDTLAQTLASLDESNN